jgi:hypothetical protein
LHADAGGGLAGFLSASGAVRRGSVGDSDGDPGISMADPRDVLQGHCNYSLNPTVTQGSGNRRRLLPIPICSALLSKFTYFFPLSGGEMAELILTQNAKFVSFNPFTAGFHTDQGGSP